MIDDVAAAPTTPAPTETVFATVADFAGATRLGEDVDTPAPTNCLDAFAGAGAGLVATDFGAAGLVVGMLATFSAVFVAVCAAVLFAGGDTVQVFEEVAEVVDVDFAVVADFAVALAGAVFAATAADAVVGFAYPVLPTRAVVEAEPAETTRVAAVAT